MELLPKWEMSDSFFMHSLVPCKSLTGYSNEGEPVQLSVYDTFIVSSIQEGTIKGISGNWAEKYININLSYYIPLDSNLADVTEVRRFAFQVQYDEEIGQRLVWLGMLILPFCLIGLYVWIAAPERVRSPWK